MSGADDKMERIFTKYITWYIRYGYCTIITLLFTSMMMAQNSVRLEIISLPVYHPSGADLYVTGSFNGWNPQDEKYKFVHSGNGVYSLRLELKNGSYKYKITRGNWDEVECKTGGTAMENRLIKVEGDTTVAISVEEWTDRFPAKPKSSTASKNVHIIDTAFLIPQLKRVRKIWIYLPEDYATSENHYPVIYMQDGQNVFDEATAFSGEWGVDEFLDTTLLKKCIVVAVDNGGTKRVTEYNPYDNKRFGKGEGDVYVDFLVKTLKPFIDKKYKTLKSKETTFIAGSSMGGLISFYAILKYPKIFGGAGIFSPSFRISGPKIIDAVTKNGKKVQSKIYFYAGKQESEAMVPDMLKVFEEMSRLSGSKMISVIRDEGGHNETAWKKEFPLFYEWMLGTK
jgi:predicted alpha/beta superfamily hydrolase